jgi:hypothetical protein
VPAKPLLHLPLLLLLLPQLKYYYCHYPWLDAFHHDWYFDSCHLEKEKSTRGVLEAHSQWSRWTDESATKKLAQGVSPESRPLTLQHLFLLCSRHRGARRRQKFCLPIPGSSVLHPV